MSQSKSQQWGKEQMTSLKLSILSLCASRRNSNEAGNEPADIFRLQNAAATGTRHGQLTEELATLEDTVASMETTSNHLRIHMEKLQEYLR